MANTAPGTPYVESSDLVANYPAVSESLAERVDLVGILPFANSTARGIALPTPTDGQYSYLQDTNATEFWNGSAWVAAGTAPGLVHINTTTFTAQSSVSLNNVFMSTYENYFITVTSLGSTAANLSFRYRAAGSDLSGTDYKALQNYVSTNNASTLVSSQGGNTETSILISSGDTNRYFSGLIYSPQLTAKTAHRFSGVWEGTNAGWTINSGSYTPTTVIDGFSLIAASGTITGTIRVYGYKNS